MENSKLRFLIAEDDFIIAMGIKQKVEELGFEVVSMASTALEAITRAVFDKPNIMLMDVLLSGSLDGIEASKIISYKSNIPVIFLIDGTSRDMIENKKPEVRYTVLHKPVTRASLEDAINKVKMTINFQDAKSSNSSNIRPYTF